MKQTAFMKKRRKDYCLVPKKWKNAMNNVMTDENGKLQRDYWNILKGIGAFCVVLGHCAMPVQNFVYLCFCIKRLIYAQHIIIAKDIMK